ncbi:cytochrome C biogenesis protein CcmF [Endozoicomonas montiporae]|uniref:Cytochrome C biogenesis protein CcmF n=2 Tax=Endozoicomonas montiporae TaxID=1027273 RepID=A0A081N561_9GAMM|nr:heme lyase CcmF/NrfE family subunit [Endozoicomonas montiporae]AMO57536.1 cytochrome c-type biogenesis protein CcmF [Endozoicomonas montiporae CL-33]KEQ13584.1 cytochrome C biogenesis protein CcmF [Endozoicomonas montiporae]
MNPELGLLALILAFCMALLQGIIPLAGSFTGQIRWMNMGRTLVFGQFAFVLLSFMCLVYAFVSDDFSVAYVANNSNTLLPLQYKITATWGGHEGSLLLWILVLAGWTQAVAMFSYRLPHELTARVLSVLGMISVGFLLFILFTSNPFARILPFPPLDGNDLNPLLQDFGMIVHPPMLYMGYVGFAVVFAFAIAALIEGKMDSAWARWARPWTTVAWCFLTLGIALGSWWAYYELGWGGWWFWDPVENASFMPWLVGTALMHSLAVTEKRGLFKSWTLLLAIFTFSLSLFGTFLVRSGVLTSVHAFASDPERGLFVLAYLVVVVGASLTLFAFRAPQVKGRIGFAFLSRETFLLLNNILLTIAAATVLLGTLFPLVLDALDMGMISVGPPYFNTLFVPLSMLLALCLGAGILLSWKQSLASWLWLQVRWIALVSAVGGFAFSLLYGDLFLISEALAMGLVLWIVLTIGRDILLKTRHQGLWQGMKKLRASYYGMQLAHLGLAVTFIGVAISAGYTVQKDVRMAPGDRAVLGDYTFRFDGIQRRQGPNYLSDYGTLTVFKNQRQVALMHPEKRLYQVQNMPMTEAAIHPRLSRDLYVALGESLGDGSWAVRLHVKPFVRFIWLGSVFMALGGFIAIADRRYRRRVTRKASATASDKDGAEGVTA